MRERERTERIKCGLEWEAPRHEGADSTDRRRPHNQDRGRWGDHPDLERPNRPYLFHNLHLHNRLSLHFPTICKVRRRFCSFALSERKKVSTVAPKPQSTSGYGTRFTTRSWLAAVVGVTVVQSLLGLGLPCNTRARSTRCCGRPYRLLKSAAAVAVTTGRPKNIIASTRKIIHDIKIENTDILGNPPVSVVAFEVEGGFSGINILKVRDIMGKKG